jgi:hypothetical protein
MEYNRLASITSVPKRMVFSTVFTTNIVQHIMHITQGVAEVTTILKRRRHCRGLFQIWLGIYLEENEC